MVRNLEGLTGPSHATAPTIAWWREQLGVLQTVVTERISACQVVDECGCAGAELVGVVYDESLATIYHTRELSLDDIVHELLHVAHPAWTEQAVVTETSALLAGSEAAHVSRFAAC